ELLKARRVGTGPSNKTRQQQQLQQHQQSGGSSGGGGGGAANGGGGSSSSGCGNNKRYLILTYAAEYDRVHYPLPLAFVECPTRDQLERTIDRLREVRSVR
ncbi:unnamed protein product, partial [Hapterophycus canaliculatus]